jgi:uroporphyrinogen decarboxylase
MKECVLATYRREPHDFVPCAESVLKGGICLGDNYIAEAGEGYDAWGIKWIFGGGNPGINGPVPAPGSEIMEDFEDWEQVVRFPDVDKLPWNITKNMVPENREDIVVFGLMLSGPFERMHYLAGFENSLCAFYENPEEVHAFLEAMEANRIACIDKLYETIHPDVIQMQDDWGMQTAMLISPELWREFFKPHEKRFAEHIHSLGMIYEHHSCGYIMPIVRDLVEIGVDALSPLNVCNDIPMLQKEFGSSICLIGGLNNQMIDAEGTSEEDIRLEVRRAIETYAPGGMYMPSYIPTDAEKLEIVKDEIVKYGGAYCYK